MFPILKCLESILLLLPEPSRSPHSLGFSTTVLLVRLYWNPSPPSFLCLVNLFLLIQWILLCSTSPLHKKRAVRFFISLKIDCGRRKHLITYVGIDWTIDLIRSSFPALDKALSFHPLIWKLEIRSSNKGRKTQILLLIFHRLNPHQLY